MAVLSVEGQNLFYTRPIKTEGGPALLLIHGAGGSHLGWPKEIQRLKGTNVYNLDLPGHGRSHGPGRSTVAEYADVVQSFIEAGHLKDVILIGHSMGGAVVLDLAVRNMKQVSKIVIVNSSARLRVAPQILEMTLTQPDAAAAFIVRGSWGMDAPEDMVLLGQKSMLQTDPVVLHGDFLACDCFDLRTELNKIQLPTLVIISTEDKMTPAKFGRSLAENIDGASLVLIEGAGHFSMLEKPLEVSNAIVEFLGIEH